jgi:cytochrome c-type biogenesis protein CcmH
MSWMMMIWFVFALLALLTMAGLLLPVVSGKVSLAVARSDYDKAVFRDQLAEIERDMARGLLNGEEAAAARNEISRRLLQASERAPLAAAGRRSVIFPAIVALAVPVLAGGLYFANGQPGLPDVPRAARMANAQANGDFVALVAQVEEHMAANPDDLNGWRVLGPAYRRQQRWQEAADAFANVVRLAPPDAATLSDYGEMLVLANQGTVTGEAQKAFGQAMVIDPKEPKSRFFTAIALKQKGQNDAAKAALQSLLADAPADAPWHGMVESALADMGGKPPALTEDQLQAGSAMSAGDQQQMIRGMVDNLDAKLKADPGNLEGWLRLIRARSVLGEADKAKAALATARDALKDKPEGLQALEALAKELNLL